jgi:hypothetical protein
MYLKTVYQNSAISPDTKWPPTPSKEYVSLALVRGRKCRDDYIGYALLKGNAVDILKNRNNAISIEQILMPGKNQRLLKLVLIEGAPGIGKSTLAWELCRKWGEFPCMEQYSLVILLRLREKTVQKINTIGKLFCSYVGKDKDTLIDEVLDNQGRGILFILDGFDELPQPLQREGFLLDFIKGTVLPACTVLVTSRPSATGELLTSCRAQIQKHVEILGFTQESVEAYASSIFSSEPEKLEKFRTYISASSNPAINSLMYVPLNAAIIVEIYSSSKSDGFLPHTLTELYTQLSLTILNRYLKTHDPSVRAMHFKDLPPILYDQLICLSKLAFECVRKEEVIFHSVSPDFNHFGFLDAVPALYGAGEVSYNFLHLTVQEFFAACYIAHLDDGGIEIFLRYCREERWNVVWRFVAGLTQFKSYREHITSDLLLQANRQPSSLFLFQCMFEAQTKKYFSFSTIESIEAFNPTTLDAYALGYCIANFLSEISWKVLIFGSGHHSFTCGLKTGKPCVDALNSLRVHHHRVDLAELRANPLRNTSLLLLVECKLKNTDMISLSELLPDLPSLKTLVISYNRVTDGKQDGLLKVLNQVYHTNITSLEVGNTGLGELLNSPHEYRSAIRRLIEPPSGKLEHMCVGHYDFKDDNDDKLMDLVSPPSSLKTLRVFVENLSPHSIYLRNDTCLVELYLVSLDFSPDIPDIVDVVSHNTTLQRLRLFRFRIVEHNMDALRPLVSAIHRNCTLKKVELCPRGIGGDNEAVSKYMTLRHKDLTRDSRITWMFY